MNPEQTAAALRAVRFEWFAVTDALHLCVRIGDGARVRRLAQRATDVEAEIRALLEVVA